MLVTEDIYVIICYSVVCLLPLLIAVFTKNITKIPVTAAFILSNFVLCTVYVGIANTEYPLFSGYFLKWDWVQDSFWFLTLSFSQFFIFSIIFNYLLYRINFFQYFQKLLLVKASQTQRLTKIVSGKNLNIAGIFLILLVFSFYVSSRGTNFFASEGTRFVGIFGDDSGKTYTLLNVLTLLGSSCLAISASRGSINIFAMFAFISLGSLNAMIVGERFAAVNLALPYVVLCSVSSKKVAWYVHVTFILLILTAYSVALITRVEIPFFTALTESLSNLIATPITAIDFSSPLPGMTIAHKINPTPEVSGLFSFLTVLPRLLILLSPLPSPPTLNGEVSFNPYDASIPPIYNIDVFTEVFFVFGWFGTTIYALIAGFIASTLDTIIYNSIQERKKDPSLVFSPAFFFVPLSCVWFAGLQNAAPIRASTRMYVYLMVLVVVANFLRKFIVKKQAENSVRE
jgi:hypothetical protein